MVKAYTLRPEYKDTLVGGTVVTGPEANTLDIKQALEEGNGEIVTGDSMLQGILENYYGEHGLVFDVSEALGEERKAIEEPDAANAAPAVLAPPPPSERRETGPAPLAGMAAAQHGEESEYSTFTVEELRDTLNERNVQVPAKATKPELIAALERDDNNQEGAGSGS